MVPHENVTTAFELPGYRVKRNLGVVRGIVVRSRSIIGTSARACRHRRRQHFAVQQSLRADPQRCIRADAAACRRTGRERGDRRAIRCHRDHARRNRSAGVRDRRRGGAGRNEDPVHQGARREERLSAHLAGRCPRRRSRRRSRAPSATGTPAWAPMGGCWSTRPRDAEAEGAIQLYNSDGSTAEISGNGTRCAAAFLIATGMRPAWCGCGRARDQDAAPVRARRPGFRIRNEHGTARDRAELHFRLPLSRGRATSPCSGWAIRSARCRWTISISTGAPWARRSKTTRIFPIAPTYRLSSAVDQHTIDVRF